ncbi:MAG: tyrosine-type recombinase/integrase [Terriglobia bacterium]|jgi:integrase/recombinase XerD
MPNSHLLGSFVRRFLLESMIADRNLSRNTQTSYRDAVRLLLRFIAERYGIDHTHLTVEDVNAEVVRNFLTHLEKKRSSSAATVNQRLIAIRSLFRFIGQCVPELVDLATQVEAVPLRKTVLPTIPYLEKKEMDAFLATPDRRRLQGQRDYALLLFLFNSGARASEAAHLTVGDLDLGTSPFVRILGKGRKIRLCPLWPHTAKVLRALLDRRLEGPPEDMVFLNVRGAPITRFGIHTLVERIANRTSKQMPSLQEKHVSPHVIRHSTACYLLRAGVDINTIRDWLGHVSLETTNRYAKVDLEMKAKALATCAVTEPGRTRSEEKATWRNDRDLMAFLNSL